LSFSFSKSRIKTISKKFPYRGAVLAPVFAFAALGLSVDICPLLRTSTTFDLLISNSTPLPLAGARGGVTCLPLTVI
jgi:hypothetical protein